jgi:alpha-1,6-mannosyltransferase
VRIIRLANFVAPHSGGLRTSLAELGAGYLAAGHEPVLVIPGDRDGDERCAQGRVITLRAPRVPFTGGYRVLWRRRRLARLLAALRPMPWRYRTGPRCAGPARGPASTACPRSWSRTRASLRC